MNTLIAFVILMAIAIIIAVASTIKDEVSKSGLAKKLKSSGYCINEKLDLPDIKEENHPYCFMIDKENKKWFLTSYRAEDARACDYCDIIDYSITYRDIGNQITNGDDHIYSFEKIKEGNGPLLIKLNLDKEDCEYLEIKLTLSEKAKSSVPCDTFVMYKARTESFQNHDYVLPSVCFMNAADFENLLYEIMYENTK